ncbi:MAG: 6-carboxytetrahydropterin synthase QueD [Clostridia bacterium]|nr:MAG: 6-carboxytetrahydropterin synthase QueD [Clostridia bacterium]
MYRLRVKDHFQAAHQLPDHPGKCSRLHGHTYQVEICVAGNDLGAGGMLMDLGELKQVVSQALTPLDHSYLNEVPELQGKLPTAENLCRYLYDCLQAEMPAQVLVEEVQVWESDHAGAGYRGEDGCGQ